mmetsp:Transcript_56138/g.135799  ORF Transcript_56138/g.135799 Transcript_56138/m.135799 type:complete len:270 (-) Transcript_56138:597-1406(-)
MLLGGSARGGAPLACWDSPALFGVLLYFCRERQPPLPPPNGWHDVFGRGPHGLIHPFLSLLFLHHPLQLLRATCGVWSSTPPASMERTFPLRQPRPPPLTHYDWKPDVPGVAGGAEAVRRAHDGLHRPVRSLLPQANLEEGTAVHGNGHDRRDHPRGQGQALVVRGGRAPNSAAARRQRPKGPRSVCENRPRLRLRRDQPQRGVSFRESLERLLWGVPDGKAGPSCRVRGGDDGRHARARHGQAPDRDRWDGVIRGAVPLCRHCEQGGV